MTGVPDRLATALADRYRIEREIGAGGMATVFLAHDLRHHRKVALKVLRPELAAVIGAERFLHEITTTANLQHPHILPLHDSGTVDGTVFYVMPFVEGETLRHRLGREKQLPIDDALRITREVASALDYAHRHGVIHRDIKPENILLHDGSALVADFGIALAASTAGGSRMTETGMSLGTPHYMSPEQAMGERELTARSDVYALGCVLYEMLVGEPPFTGPTAQAIVAKVLTGEPRGLVQLRRTVPAHVEAVALTALAKLPADRFASAAQLAEALGNPNYVTPAARLVPRTESMRRGNRLAAVMTGVATLAIAAAIWAMASRPEAGPRPVLRVALAMPDSEAIASGPGNRVALSPDGLKLAYVGPAATGSNSPRRIWLKARDQVRPIPLPGSEGAYQPFFAPDGKQLGYLTPAPYAIRVVPLDGGPPTTVADSGVGQLGAAWGPDGFIYLNTTNGVGRVRASGGRVEAVTELDRAAAEETHAYPSALPNGRGLLITVVHRPVTNQAAHEIAVVDLRTRKHRTLLKGIAALYAAPGFLLFASADGALHAAPFDQDKLELTGPAVPLLDRLGIGSFGSVDLAVSTTGTMVYLAGALGTLTEPVWVGREGRVTPVDPAWRGDIEHLALSPDGNRLAVSLAAGDIWIKQLDRGPLSRVSFGEGTHSVPAWTADGRAVTFVSDMRDHISLYGKQADGSGTAELLVRERRRLAEGFWSPDGQWLIYRSSATEPGAGDILARRKGDDTTTVALLSAPYQERQPALSPDGRWLAYRSNETGREEIYVRPFPDVGKGKWQVSASGGTEPVWARNGRELFYVNAANQLVAATIATQSGFSASNQRVLFNAGGFFRSFTHPTYDVSPDGRFVMLRVVRGSGEGNLILVDNWFEELTRKMKDGGR